MAGIISIYRSIIPKVERILPTISPFYFLILLFITSLFSAFPSYDLAFDKEMAENWNSILIQKEHPFTNFSYSEASHSANLTFRLTPILFGKFLGINSIFGFLIIQLISLFLLFLVVYKLFNQLIDDPVNSRILSLAVTFTFIGNVLCSDYRGFFDVMAYLFIGASMATKRPLLIFAFSMLAFFTDERALIASSLIFVFYILQDKNNERKLELKDLLRLNNRALTLIGTWLTYFITRFSLSYFFGLKTNTGGMIDYLKNEAANHINIAPFAIWTGVEGFWFLLILASIILIQKREWIVALMYLTSITLILGVALWTYDITRSMAYLMPGIFIGALVISKTESLLYQRILYGLVLILCVFPTYYAGGPKTITWLLPLPIQLIRILLD